MVKSHSVQRTAPASRPHPTIHKKKSAGKGYLFPDTRGTVVLYLGIVSRVENGRSFTNQSLCSVQRSSHHSASPAKPDWYRPRRMCDAHAEASEIFFYVVITQTLVVKQCHHQSCGEEDLALRKVSARTLPRTTAIRNPLPLLLQRECGLGAFRTWPRQALIVM